MKSVIPGLFLRRGKDYWFRHTVGGVQKRHSLGTEDLTVAVARAEAIRTTPTLSPGGPFEAEVNAYTAERRATGGLSLQYSKTRKIILLGEARRMGWHSPAGLTSDAVRLWYEGLRATKAEATAVHYLTALRAFLQWCVDAKTIRVNPAVGFRRAKVRLTARGHYLSAETVRRLFDACNREDLRFCLFAGFHCGMRRAEICNAQWHWFDPSAALVTVLERRPGDFGPTDPGWRPKFNRKRSIPLSAAFAEWVRVNRKPSGFVLHPDRLDSLSSKYRWDFKRPYCELLRHTGVKATIHDMRRTFSVLKIAGGVPIYRVAKWLGDGIQTVEKHYAQFIPTGSDIETGL